MSARRDSASVSDRMARPAGARLLRPLLLGTAVGLVALGAFWHLGGRRPAPPAPIQLPAMPAGRSVPTALAARLRRAEQQASIPATRLEGVAEFGRLCHASGYTEAAAACWQILQAAQPREARWCYYLADLRRRASDYAGMAGLLARTVKLRPDYAPAWLRLADMQLKTGQLAEAERAYGRRLALLPGDAYARLGLARIALQEGEPAQAREQLQQLVHDHPAFPPAQNLYAEILAAAGETAAAARHRGFARESGRFREADDPWLDELVDWCFDYEQLCLRGTVDYQTKHGDRGKACFERAIEIRSEALAAYELLGSRYLDLQEPAKARDVFEQGLQRSRDPRFSSMIFVYLSRAYRELHQPAEAVRVARDGLARTGESLELYTALGVALIDAGQPDAAAEALRAAVARNPNDAAANFNLAQAAIALGRLDEAVEALHRSLVLNPTYPSSLALLAQIEIDSGRWRSAAHYLQPLYDSHPELPEARAKMVDCHLRAGIEAEQARDLAAAEQHYRAGLTIDAGHAELQLHLGVLCLIGRRFADAVAPLEAYRRLAPDNPRGCLYLGQAYLAIGRRNDARLALAAGAQLAEGAGNSATARHCRELLARLQ